MKSMSAAAGPELGRCDCPGFVEGAKEVSETLNSRVIIISVGALHARSARAGAVYRAGWTAPFASDGPCRKVSVENDRTLCGCCGFAAEGYRQFQVGLTGLLELLMIGRALSGPG